MNFSASSTCISAHFSSEFIFIKIFHFLGPILPSHSPLIHGSHQPVFIYALTNPVIHVSSHYSIYALKHTSVHILNHASIGSPIHSSIHESLMYLFIYLSIWENKFWVEDVLDFAQKGRLKPEDKWLTKRTQTMFCLKLETLLKSFRGFCCFSYL